MENQRPNPDQLLTQIKAQETLDSRGKLTVFFGAAAGVGKTYAMLSRARHLYSEGRDVVIGYAEPHARPETEALLLGMEILPYRTVDYRGSTLKELDLDAALARRPELLIVDEFAHTNAHGSRHAKRWQDIQELLRSGIDVYTTVNVQHLESLNDVVAQISGVTVRETLPDAVFESADEVILVDLTPDELLGRLKEGKVYVPQQAALALENFFKKANLTALRELALRKTADRVNAQVLSARQQQFERHTWPTADRLLVAISPSPTSGRVIRAAKRLAVSLRAQWLAVYVETPASLHLAAVAQERLRHNARLAERLGAEVVTLSGQNVAEEIISYSRSRNVTKLVLGKTERTRWRERLFGSPMDELMRLSGDIDVYVIHGRHEELIERRQPGMPRQFDSIPYLKTAAIVGLMTLICAAMYPLFELSNLIMVYLLGVAFVAARFGQGPAIMACVLSVLIFDFCFVPPRGTFAVSDSQYLLTFGIMLVVGMLISRQTARIRNHAQASRQREKRTEALYRMTREIMSATDPALLISLVARHVQEVFQATAVVLLADGADRLTGGDIAVISPSELGIAQWVQDQQKQAGKGTDTLPASDYFYLPLTASRRTVGVIGLKSSDPQRLSDPDQRHFLEAFTAQVALAIERHNLAQNARQLQLQAETEKMRSSLLSAVSHDLRTPLAVIAGASSSLLEGSIRDPKTGHELVQTIYEEANRLSTLVGNLLDVTRLESGAIAVNKQWNVLEEIIGSALNRMEKQLAAHPVTTSILPDLPLAPVDGVLIEQALINLIENAAKYTPANTPIEISATANSREIIVQVADRGPGLAPSDLPRLFEKFFRGAGAGGQRGAGLGLSICAAIIKVHGGRIWVENRQAPEQGAIFRFSLPIEGQPPKLPDSDQDTIRS